MLFAVSFAGFKLPVALLAATRSDLVDTSFLSSSIGILPFPYFQFNSTVATPPPADETWLIPTWVPQVLDKSLWSARLWERGSQGAALPGRSRELLPGPSGWVGFGASQALQEVEGMEDTALLISLGEY